MKFISRNSVRTCVAALGLVAICAPAFAGDNWSFYDRKTYTGAQCQPANGAHAMDFTIFQGRMRNDNASARWSTCAITFDSENSIDQADGSSTTAQGAIRVLAFLDYSAVPNVVGVTYKTTCTLSGRGPYTASKTQTLSVTSGRTTTVQELDFQDAIWTGLNIGNHESLQLSCQQPSKVALIGFKIYEEGETGHYYYTP